MRSYRILSVLFFIFMVSAAAYSQNSAPEINIAPNAPKDKSIGVVQSEQQKFEDAIKPAIETAKKTYPAARDRFVKGLPPKHSFFITTRLHDSTGKFEQVFIAVKEILNGKVTGVIASDIGLVTGFKAGDIYTFSESELMDWTITNPDGSEDGNFVGKFLDTYQSKEN